MRFVVIHCAAVYEYCKSVNSAKDEVGLARRRKKPKSLKMGAANKIPYMYTLRRTNIMANSAARALFVVDSRKVIFNGDSTRGAGFLALAAADTAVEAHLTYLRALIVA